jgi:hypothetical protein
MSVSRVISQEHVVVSHPSEVDWFLRGVDSLDEERIEAVRAGLGYEADEMQMVVNAVNVAAIRTSTYRQMHEAVNVQKLGLNPAEYDEYLQHARYHGSKAGFVAWFAERAESPLTDKVALALAVVRQRGYWETGGLDQIFRALEGDLSVVAPDLPMKVFAEEDLADNPIKYKEIPMRGAYGAPARLDFVTVRRRRPIANVGGLKISKEATALILVNELPRDERCLLRERAFTDADVSNTEAALVAGEAFQRAIRTHHNGGEDFGVLPNGAHYVATADV